MNCPICRSTEHVSLLTLDCGSFDQSTLYKNLNVVSCKRCGHVRNNLSDEQYKDIITYYKNEYSQSTIQSPNKNGDIPGSENKTTLDRYEKLFKSVSSYIKKSDKVLDIGCAIGGFLKYLKDNGFTYLYGVDVSDEYTKVARLREGIIIKDGFAENVPFSETFDFIFSDQVLEHLYNPNMLFVEANRLLKDGGHLCISVPNAQYYAENHFFDYYWFLLREHIQHYDAFHLTQLAARHGFIPENITYEKVPMINDKILLSIMTITFRRGKAETDIRCDRWLEEKTIQYVKQCNGYLEHRKESADKITTPVIAFGASRELLYLYSNTSLKQRLTAIVDDIPAKQKYTLDNIIKVYPSSVIPMLPKESSMIMTAFAHQKILSEKATNLKYAGKIIDFWG